MKDLQGLTRWSGGYQIGFRALIKVIKLFTAILKLFTALGAGFVAVILEHPTSKHSGCCIFIATFVTR